MAHGLDATLKTQERNRTLLMEGLETERNEIRQKHAGRVGSGKFQAQVVEADGELKAHTVGLVRLEDFQRIRDSLKGRQAAAEEEDGEKIQRQKERDKARKRKRREGERRAKLSFDVDLDVSHGDGDGKEADVNLNDDNGVVNGSNGLESELKRQKHSKESSDSPSTDPTSTIEPRLSPPRKFKLGKDPSVNTAFLPDADRAELEKKEREELRSVWEEEQQKIKNEPITISVSYYDGSSQRVTLTASKGDTITQFLSKSKSHFHTLRGVNTENLLFIKEDLIIPLHYSFYDFIINKTWGKSGPLFDFEKREDVRLESDTRVDTNESHTAKIVERSWYDRNKHIFPASRWEVFDPAKDYKNLKKDKDKKDLISGVLKGLSGV